MTDHHRSTLNRLVIALVGQTLANRWWTTNNAAFVNRTPLSLMNDDEWTTVRDYLMNYAYGK